MGYVDVLRWTLGAPVSFPADNLRGRADEIAHILYCHRLTRRFLHRLGSEEDPSLDVKPALEAIRERDDEATRKLENYAGALLEIVRSSGGRRLLLKGCMVSDLLKNDRVARPGNDIDIAVDSAEELGVALRELGYSMSRRKLTPAPHEYGQYVRGTTFVDVHRTFPVWDVSSTVSLVDRRPAVHPGTWRQPSRSYIRREISFEELWQHRRASTGHKLSSLFVPCAAMQVVILAAHVFESSVHRALALPYATAPLVQVAEIEQLARSALFDVREYRSLATSYGAHDAIRFSRGLLRWLTGRDSLPCCCDEPGCTPRVRYPRQVFNGLWIDAGWEPDDLIVRRVSMADLVRRMGANSIRFQQPGDSNWYSVLQGESPRLDRVIAMSSGAGCLSFALRAERGADGLRFDVLVRESARDGATLLAMWFDDRRYEVRFDLADGGVNVKTSPGGPEPRATVSGHPEGHHYLVQVRWSHRASVGAGSAEVPLLLGVMRRTPGMDSQTSQATTAVPLLLR